MKEYGAGRKRDKSKNPRFEMGNVQERGLGKLRIPLYRIAEVGGCSYSTVKRAVQIMELEPLSLTSVVEFIARRWKIKDIDKIVEERNIKEHVQGSWFFRNKRKGG